ncbi:MAG: class B sortase [Clostridia bacterium]|nr:class B sortase [Clostridia bacterium]
MRSKEERLRKKKGRRIFLLIICAMVFAGSCGLYVLSRIQYRESSQDYGEASAIAGLNEDITALPEGPQPFEEPEVLTGDPEPEEPISKLEDITTDANARRLAMTNLDALREESADVKGWIVIPGTLVDYPLMQGDDNQFYLEHTWLGKANAGGSIFIECQCSEDFTDFNTIIYGHRMGNTSMFGTLASYKKQSFFEEHPSVYICVDGCIRRYDIFASFEPKVTDCTYWVMYDKEEYKQRVIDFSLEKSVIDCGIVPDTSDSIITLSTCTGNGHATRWVVQAVLAGEMKTAESSESLRQEDLK